MEFDFQVLSFLNAKNSQIIINFELFYEKTKNLTNFLSLNQEENLKNEERKWKGINSTMKNQRKDWSCMLKQTIVLQVI